MKSKENPINEDPQELQDLLFCFLVMVYGTVEDGDKFSYEDFGLGIVRFHATSHLKIKAKQFFW